MTEKEKGPVWFVFLLEISIQVYLTHLLSRNGSSYCPDY